MKLPDLKQIKTGIQDFRRDVIRMMRLRFVLTAMAILIVVFIIMLTSINMIMKTVSQSQSMRLLEQIAGSERYNSLNNQPPNAYDGERPPEKPTGPRPTEPQTEAAAAAFYPDVQEGGIVSLSWGGWDFDSQAWGEWNWESLPDGWQGWQPEVQEVRPPDVQQDAEDQQDNGGWNGWGWNPWVGWGNQGGQNDGGQNNDGQNKPENKPNDPERQPDRPEDQGGQGGWPKPPQDWQMPSDMTPPWIPQNPQEQDENSERQETEPPMHSEPPPPEVREDVTEPPAPQQTSPPQTQAPKTPETQTRTETETETTEPPAVTAPPETAPPVPEPREPRPDRWNVSVTIDHFAIMADAEGNYLGLRNTEDYTDDQAKEILAGILATNKSKGMYGWLQFCRAEKSYGTLLVITDKTSDQGLLNNLFRLTVVVGLAMLLVLLVILIFLSKKITDPVQSAFTRQKQFVSDAGHELKTPIAVLTANADILQDEIGENKWLGYMQEQIARMNQLVGDLLRLARMDNATQQYNFEDFDLSMAVAATTLPFESAAFEQNRNLEMDIQPNVIYHGSEQHIRQLCAIFIDNALKYSNENGIIKVTLLKRGEHCILEFYNTGCEISQSETERIFERFYRGDKARNNKGKSGYGLGLAIAKSIMDVHRIKIQVTCEQGGWIRFLLTM